MAATQYGTVTIDGQQYIERAQIFPQTLDITTNLIVLAQQRVTLPGVANFLLKGLTREVTVAGVSTSLRFRFRLGNSDGTTWYFAGGRGGQLGLEHVATVAARVQRIPRPRVCDHGNNAVVHNDALHGGGRSRLTSL